MAKQKVKLLVPTVGKKAGDVIEVESADADALVANHNAVLVESKSSKD